MRFLVKINGEKHEICTQQYEVGLYVCIYKNNRIVEQFGVNDSEEEFIKNLEKSDDIEIISKEGSFNLS